MDDGNRQLQFPETFSKLRVFFFIKIDIIILVPNLIKGQEYEFRIVALNKGGFSDPSDPSKKVIAKARNCKFFNKRLIIIIF